MPDKTIQKPSRRSSLTSAQAHATLPNLTAWVGASAGTGKTHVLTARALRLMLTGTQPENILCLTYTKAAAAEMKNRIFKELGSWTIMDDASLSAAIFERTEEYADAKMLRRARQLFARVLDLSGGLSVQTFHSFCQSLLMRFPLEAGLTPGFEGMEEARAADIMANAKDQMLSASRPSGVGGKGHQDTDVGSGDTLAHSAEVLTKALQQVSVLATEQTFDAAIDRLSFFSREVAAAGFAYGGYEGVFSALHRLLGLSLDDTPDSVLDAMIDRNSIDTQNLRAVALKMLEGSKTEAQNGHYILQFLTTEPETLLKVFDDFKSVFLTQKNAPKTRMLNKATLAADPDFQIIMETEQLRLSALQTKLDAAWIALATKSLLMLGIEQLSRYERVKQAKGLLDFDDMIVRTENLLDRTDVSPWILYKLDHRIDHILVDEAQDTNSAQWKVVRAIASEFFAGVGARDTLPKNPRTVFAVGDAKQSIFSFQRADPKQFLIARDDIFEAARGADQHAENITLNLSFRSGEAVLGLVDSIFADGNTARIGLSDFDKTITHSTSRLGHGGLVELWPLMEDDPKVEPEYWLPPVQQGAIKTAEIKTAERIAYHIHEKLRTEEFLPSLGRPVQAGDIMIILRRRGKIVSPLVRALKNYGIPVAGKDRMSLSEELAVQDVLAAVRFVLQPHDDLNTAVLLKSPLVGLSEEALFDLAYNREGSLWHAVQNKQKPKVTKMLRTLLSLADMNTPFAFFTRILGPLGGRQLLASRLGQDIDDALDELLAESLRFESQFPSSLQGFLGYIESSNAVIKRDMEAVGNQVRIMTAHSAKGLQAPIVYLTDITSLPDTGRDSRILMLPDTMGGSNSVGSGVPIWSSAASGAEIVQTLKAGMKARSLAEYRRLLYVALTRAEDQLFVAGWKGQKNVSEDSWYKAVETGFQGLEETVRLKDGTMRYHIPFTAIGTTGRIEATKTSAPISLPQWVGQPAPIETDPPRPLTPSRPKGKEPAVRSPLKRGIERRYLRGRAMHSLLEWLPDADFSARHGQTQEQAALSYLAIPAHGLSKQEIAQAWQQIKTILTHKEFGHLFGPNSQAEVQIAGMVGKRAISGQVDRLVIDDDSVLIVDYKTNRSPPSDPEGIAGVYVKQMALYWAALKQIYPDKTVHAALLWTDSATLMKIPENHLQHALDEMGIAMDYMI